MIDKTNAKEKLTLTVGEAAELLGVSRPTVYVLMRAEGFPAFKIGRRTLISRAGLADWINSQVAHGS